MIAAIVDTTVILHLFRKYQPALNWFNNQQTYGVTSIIQLEVIEGASTTANQTPCKTLLEQFEILYPISADQHRAMEQLEQLQFSHHLGKEGYLIASIAYRQQLPPYTHNLKDMVPLIGKRAIKPYA